jgi:hypothetical protein
MWLASRHNGDVPAEGQDGAPAACCTRAPAAQRSKRHDYVTESYLRAWADRDSRVGVRRRGGSGTYVAHTRNVAVESGLYAVDPVAGPDDRVEAALAELEAPLPALLARLREGRPTRRGDPAREDISVLLALQLVRTPEHFDQLTFPYDVADATGENPVSRDGMRRYLTGYLGSPPAPQELQGALDWVNYNLGRHAAPTRQEVIDILFGVALNELAPRLEDKAWAVEISTGPPFITTDRPVTPYRRPGRDRQATGSGLESAEEIWFALGPLHLLVLRPRFPEHRLYVPAARVEQVNRRLAAASHRQIIGRPADADTLLRLPLRAVRPHTRFGGGPLLREGPDGQLHRDGEVLHMYLDYSDDEGPAAPPS